MAGHAQSTATNTSGNNGIYATPQTFLTFNSDPGDYIGLGRHQTWTSSDGSFLVTSGNGNNIEIRFSSLANWWTLDFSTPPGTQLSLGTYDGAIRMPIQADTPGIDISGSGRGCNNTSGTFTVKDIVYGKRSVLGFGVLPGVETYVKSFAADFEQHCENKTAALRGSIYYNSTGKPEPQPPSIDLDSLSINCPSSLSYGNTGTCSATASYTDGSKKAVTPKWSINTWFVRIDGNGLISVDTAGNMTGITITADWSENGISKSATAVLTLNPVTLAGLSLNCPSTIIGGDKTPCVATASYTDGTKKVVTPTWHIDSSLVYIDQSGAIIPGLIINTNVTITATWSIGDVTKTATAMVLVNPPVKTLTALAVTCPSTLVAGTTANCTTKASYSDGSEKTVVADWWASSNGGVLSVDAYTGQLRAFSVANSTSVTITARKVDNAITQSATTTVVVSPTPSSPTLATPTTAAVMECFLNWAEAHYPQLFPIGDKANSTITFGPYSFRSYSSANAYLGFLTTTGHVIYAGPITGGQVIDLGSYATTWASTVGCK